MASIESGGKSLRDCVSAGFGSGFAAGLFSGFVVGFFCGF